MNKIHWEDLSAKEIVAMFEGEVIPAMNDNDFAVLIADDKDGGYEHPEGGSWRTQDGINYRLYIS